LKNRKKRTQTVAWQGELCLVTKKHVKNVKIRRGDLKKREDNFTISAQNTKIRQITGVCITQIFVLVYLEKSILEI